MTTAEDFVLLSSEHHYSGWAIDVRTDTIRMPDGTIAKRDVIGHPGAVGVVALDADDKAVMVRQYRHPVGQFLLELPAGLLDVAGEPALQAAQRELYEEASLTASDWQVLVDIHTSPGMTDEAIRIFLARGLVDVPAEERFESEHEEITMTVERHSLQHLADMALRGELTNGPAVAGVFAARQAQSQGWHGLRSADSPWRARPTHGGELDCSDDGR
ncbi:NUDIX domain-containing protein [Jatrophihabitans sp. DSM 45814]